MDYVPLMPSYVVLSMPDDDWIDRATRKINNQIMKAHMVYGMSGCFCLRGNDVASIQCHDCGSKAYRD